MKKSIMGFDQHYLSTISIVKENSKGKTIVQKVDYTDLAILRWFVDFQCSGKMTSIEFGGERYFYVSYKKILEDMPLLDMSKKALYDRMQKLVQMKLLKHHFHQEFGNQAFYCMGERYINLIHSENSDPFGSQLLNLEKITSEPYEDNFRTLEKLTSDNSNINNSQLDKELNNNYNPLYIPPEGETDFFADSPTEIENIPDNGRQIIQELKSRINALFNRRNSTTWTDKEQSKLRQIAKRNDVLEECAEIEELYNSGYEYRRQSVQTFLNNWQTELDRARNSQSQSQVNVRLLDEQIRAMQ